MAARNPAPNDVVITGIGLVTSMGVGAQTNWKAASGGAAPVFDSETFKPYVVHPLPEIDWNDQIPKRGDQRQMETWQRIGTYVAGLALDDAGMKEDAELTSTMDMIVAAAGGERDVDVDTMILAGASQAANRDVLVNEKLTTELRPTLFLAQLSNLLAGNISIVHKVTGSSRTFMGEEGAGISAVQLSAARIRSGQSTHALVGGAYNSEHPDMLLGYELGHYLARDGWSPVWQRETAHGGGVIPGSGGAFLVLESRAHAEHRGARIYAVLDEVRADMGDQDVSALHARLTGMARDVKLENADLIVSSASGAKDRLKAEKELLSRDLAKVPVRGVTSLTGHLREAQFPASVAFAALALFHGKPLAQIDSRFESPASVKPKSVGVLTVGFDFAEGAAMLHADAGASA